MLPSTLPVAAQTCSHSGEPGGRLPLPLAEKSATSSPVRGDSVIAPVSRFAASQPESCGSTARAACVQCTRSDELASHHE